MDLKRETFKFNLKMNKERIIFLFCAGLLLFILSIPGGGGEKGGGEKRAVGKTQEETGEKSGDGTAFAGSGTAARESSYEEEMERRVREILSRVDGVGEVDVMIVLRSSGEKVLHVDKNSSSSLTEEEESGGGKRKIDERQLSENTVTNGSGGDGAGPVVEKEIRPELSGIVISADGGGSQVIKAEISGAMEALFDLPPHKIKVLRRVKKN